MSAVPANHPVLVALETKVKAQRGAAREPDSAALRAEMNAVEESGYSASSDTMHSHWTTLRTYLKLQHEEIFTSNPTSITNLIQRIRTGEFTNMVELFADFMSLVYTRENFILMPVIRGRGRGGNLNLLRGSIATDYDYWDRTLDKIARGGYEKFFHGDDVAPRFRLDGNPHTFSDYVRREHLEMCFDGDDVAELWTSHLTATRAAATKVEDIQCFLSNASKQIRARNRAFGVTSG